MKAANLAVTGDILIRNDGNVLDALRKNKISNSPYIALIPESQKRAKQNQGQKPQMIYTKIAKTCQDALFTSSSAMSDKPKN